MKIVHRICCGVDVHKRNIVATIAATDKHGVTRYFTATFSTITKDLYRFRAWLTSHNCFDVCMESTGRYWIPVFNILEDGGMRVVLTHPMHVRSIKGKKTDRNDATRIAGLFKHDLVGNSFIPPPEIRALRELARYRYKLVCMRSSERNRYQDCMTVSSIGLASALSDPFGQTATGIMRYVLSSEVFDEAAIGRPILKSAKKKTDLILESIRNFRIESDKRFKMNIVSAHMEHLDKAILATEVELCARIGPHMDIVKHLAEQLPGISLLYASLIISEIGADMTVFESDKHLASWAGLAPANNQSACKKKSVRISKAGQFLKPLLVNCALAAIKSKSNPYFAVKYQKIKKRRGHKRAIVAICRMLLTCVYHMILKREAFNPSDIESVFKPAPKNQVLTEKNALAFLAQQGCDVSLITKTIPADDSMVKLPLLKILLDFIPLFHIFLFFFDLVLRSIYYVLPATLLFHTS